MNWFRSLNFKEIFVNLVQEALPQAGRWAERLAEPTVRGLIRSVLGWYKRALLSYAAAALLALVCVFSICAAASDGLVAVGVPPWASHLMIAASTAIGAWILVERAGGEPSEVAGEDREKDKEGAPTFNIRIETKAAPRPRPAKSRSKRPAAPRRRLVDVHPNDEGWEVSQSSSSKKKVYPSKSRAVKAAMSAARKKSARVVIHSGNGRIREVLQAGESRDN